MRCRLNVREAGWEREGLKGADTLGTWKIKIHKLMGFMELVLSKSRQVQNSWVGVCVCMSQFAMAYAIII